ncbi:uncharacterized protein K460DRAFT_364440 [Cucurbitaria berberidis CBS 394.84]|uniref:Uncharacterized protein n=1 Tax=Cucurbitaria berberidis CBS 394.84 TaxID=1168544 RepID=A0A9P4LAW9_9PLEO|nr:uncharacterized protein K460DRAFT_364440 [Cucurbitaria berberidis CBS 394.84]KAF1848450.1 hypothetical protein K460DRAFT_364440 [Cucurbitaria berberidis CBS 394.84]
MFSSALGELSPVLTPIQQQKFAPLNEDDLSLFALYPLRRPPTIGPDSKDHPASAPRTGGTMAPWVAPTLDPDTRLVLASIFKAEMYVTCCRQRCVCTCPWRAALADCSKREDAMSLRM